MKKLFLKLFILMMAIAMPFATFAKDEPKNTSIVNSKAFDKFVDRANLTDQFDSQKTLPQVIGDIVGQVLALMGVIFAILIIYAGVRWMTAGGDSGRIEKAKNILINSVIGLIITLGAYAISWAVVEIFIRSTTK